MKKRTIGTPDQGIPEFVINEETGLLTHPKGSKGLYEPFKKIFGDKE